MTNTTCTDCHRRLTAANTTIADDLCDDCYELAGHEAAHQDGDHDAEAHPDCLLCDPNARADRSRKATTRVSGARIDHRPCYAAGTHEKSFEGRESCRRAGGPKL